MSGRVVHFEIPTDDDERARQFYRSAFGWELQSIPEVSYTMAITTPADEQGMPKEPGAINGGMFPRQAPLATPVITIDVADIDAALEQITTLGGEVVQPKMTVMDMGFAAYFRDTEGNIMGLWQTAG